MVRNCISMGGGGTRGGVDTDRKQCEDQQTDYSFKIIKKRTLPHSSQPLCEKQKTPLPPTRER